MNDKIYARLRRMSDKVIRVEVDDKAGIYLIRNEEDNGYVIRITPLNDRDSVIMESSFSDEELSPTEK